MNFNYFDMYGELLTECQEINKGIENFEHT